MYHPPSKRKQLIQRVVIYTLMAASVVVLVAILVFYMLGWQFNRADGRIEQGGLVQFGSRPSGAMISIDGNDLGGRTSSKATLPAGQHIITMSRSGYDDWQKSINVVPGTILWLNYARLIPKDLPVDNVADYTAIGSMIASPDNETIALVNNPDKPQIQLVNISGDQIKTKDLVLPASSFTAPPTSEQRFTLVAWDDSSRNLLVKHTYGDHTEWLVVDSQDVSATKNVTRLLDIKASKVVFSATNNQLLYVQIGHDVRQVNLSRATMSRPLISNIAEFAVNPDDQLVYTTLPSAKTGERSVGYYTAGADTARTIRSYSDDGTTSLHVAIGTYFHHDYVSIAYSDHIEILSGELPSSNSTAPSALDIVANVSTPDGVDYLTTHTGGRFVVAQKGSSYTTYDLELRKMTTTEIKGTTSLKRELGWLDNYMLWSDRDGQLRLYEFDGSNQHTIMPVVPGYDVTLSPNGKYIYGISKDDDGYHLSRVRLILS